MLPQWRIINDRYDFLFAWGGQNHSQYATTVIANFLRQFYNPQDWYKYGGMRKLYFHFIVDDTVTSEDREKITNILTHFWKSKDIDKCIECKTLFYDAPKDYLEIFEKNKWLTCGYLGANAYYRLLAPRILPKDVKKVLYLDTDIVLRNTNAIFKFMCSDISKYQICGQHDTMEDWFSHNAANPPYVCTGVMFMNLDKMREDKIYEKCVELMLDNEYWENISDYDKIFELMLYDQEVINAVCDKKKELPFEFCYYPYKNWYLSFSTSASIIHVKFYNPEFIKNNGGLPNEIEPVVKSQADLLEEIKKMWK